MTGIKNVVPMATPGLGPGWTRVAAAVSDCVSPHDIEGIWLFPPVRREEREWGVAVVSCNADDDRRRILTASYMFITRGREKGHGKVSVDVVGESPATIVEDVIQGVQDRTGEMDPPVTIEPSLWFEESLAEPRPLDPQVSESQDTHADTDHDR